MLRFSSSCNPRRPAMQRSHFPKHACILRSLDFVFRGFAAQHPSAGGSVIVDANLTTRQGQKGRGRQRAVAHEFSANSRLDIATMSSTRDRRGCNKVVENLTVVCDQSTTTISPFIVHVNLHWWMLGQQPVMPLASLRRSR